jgi:hypothetical protein
MRIQRVPANCHMSSLEHASVDKEHEVAWEILRYLDEHPEAKDTIDGIARWWLRGSGGDLRIVERAIEYLLSRDLVIETRRRGVPPYYRINPHRRETIADLLGA